MGKFSAALILIAGLLTGQDAEPKAPPVTGPITYPIQRGIWICDTRAQAVDLARIWPTREQRAPTGCGMLLQPRRVQILPAGTEDIAGPGGTTLRVWFALFIFRDGIQYLPIRAVPIGRGV